MAALDINLVPNSEGESIVSPLIFPTSCVLCHDKVPLNIDPSKTSRRADLTGHQYDRLGVQHFVGLMPLRGTSGAACAVVGRLPKLSKAPIYVSIVAARAGV
jgi:hypothetical protein